MQVILKFHTLLFILKLLLPRVRIRFIKILRCRMPLFFKDTEFHPLIRHGEFGHGIIGLFRVIIRELMHPHRVKSVQQLPAGRIRRVEAVGKLLVNNDDSGGTVCRNIVIPSFHRRRRVNIRQELFDRLPDRVSTAERPHRAGLCKRVRLLFRGLFYRFRFPGRYRPGGNVPPVVIKPQIIIRIQDVAVHDLIDILPVARRGRPVHQPVRLVRGIIKQIHPDLLRHLAGKGRVFLLGHIPFQRKDQTQPGRFRRMLMRGVHTQLMGMEQGKLIQDIRCAVVHVQRQHGPAQNRPGLSPATPQMSAHKTAHILDSVLLGLCHLPIFLHCFRGGLRGAHSPAEIIPGDLVIFPSLLHT